MVTLAVFEEYSTSVGDVDNGSVRESLPSPGVEASHCGGDFGARPPMVYRRWSGADIPRLICPAKALAIYNAIAFYDCKRQARWRTGFYKPVDVVLELRNMSDTIWRLGNRGTGTEQSRQQRE
jgi:hypothetical protein